MFTANCARQHLDSFQNNSTALVWFEVVMMEYDLKKRNDPQVKTNYFLYFVVIIVNLTCFSCGTAFAWSSPVTPKLNDPDENPMGYTLSEEEVSWIVALMSLGAAVGPFAGGFLADKIGRKRTLLVYVIPLILSYALLAFSTNLYVYYVARFIKGTCVGLFLTVVPMYVGEVAEIHNRGILGCFTVFFVTIGMMYSFVVGPYLSIKWFSLSCNLGAVIFVVICTVLIPESPCYLVMKHKQEEAKKSLQKLRTSNSDEELLELAATVKESVAAQAGILDIFKTEYLTRTLRLSVGLMVIQQLTAISVINYYMQLIFESAGSQIPSEVSVMIVGAIQILGTFLSTLVVDKLGRRPLLLSSTLFTSLSLFILSLYFYLKTIKDVSNISWLPITTMIVYMVFYNVGIGPIAFAVMGEIYPPHVKSIASSLSVGCCYFCSFLAAKLFPILVSGVGNWFAFLFFGIGNSLGVVFIWFLMPETKGKTLSEILQYFK